MHYDAGRRRWWRQGVRSRLFVFIHDGRWGMPWPAFPAASKNWLGIPYFADIPCYKNHQCDELHKLALALGVDEFSIGIAQEK